MEAVRVGTIIAHSKDAYRKWQGRKTAPKGRSLTGAALERAIAGIAEMFPGNVVRETVPA